MCSHLALVVSLPLAVEQAGSFRGTERKLLGREELLTTGALLLRVARARLASHRVTQRLAKKNVTCCSVMKKTRESDEKQAINLCSKDDIYFVFFILTWHTLSSCSQALGSFLVKSSRLKKDVIYNFFIIRTYLHLLPGVIIRYF